MNISGRIHTGLRYNHQRYVQGRKIDSVMRIMEKNARTEAEFPIFPLKAKDSSSNEEYG
jgi:hypothetical protein